MRNHQRSTIRFRYILCTSLAMGAALPSQANAGMGAPKPAATTPTQSLMQRMRDRRAQARENAPARGYVNISGVQRQKRGDALVEAVVGRFELESARYVPHDGSGSGTLVLKGSKAVVRAASSHARAVLPELDRNDSLRFQTTVDSHGYGRDWATIRSTATSYAGLGAALLSPTILGSAIGYLAGDAHAGLQIGGTINAGLAILGGIFAAGAP